MCPEMLHTLETPLTVMGSCHTAQLWCQQRLTRSWALAERLSAVQPKCQPAWSGAGDAPVSRNCPSVSLWALWETRGLTAK